MSIGFEVWTFGLQNWQLGVAGSECLVSFQSEVATLSYEPPSIKPQPYGMARGFHVLSPEPE